MSKQHDSTTDLKKAIGHAMTLLGRGEAAWRLFVDDAAMAYSLHPGNTAGSRPLRTPPMDRRPYRVSPWSGGVQKGDLVQTGVACHGGPFAFPAPAVANSRSSPRPSGAVSGRNLLAGARPDGATPATRRPPPAPARRRTAGRCARTPRQKALSTRRRPGRKPAPSRPCRGCT